MASRYDKYVHQVDGRWVVAEWSEHHSQWQSSNRKPPPGMENSYRYTYARSLRGLVHEGVRTYATRRSALAIASMRHGGEE